MLRRLIRVVTELKNSGKVEFGMNNINDQCCADPTDPTIWSQTWLFLKLYCTAFILSDVISNMHFLELYTVVYLNDWNIKLNCNHLNERTEKPYKEYREWRRLYWFSFLQLLQRRCGPKSTEQIMQLYLNFKIESNT